MERPKKNPNYRYMRTRVVMAIGLCCLVVCIIVSVAAAEPKGNGSLHANAHAQAAIAAALAESKVNPVGIITGSGGAKAPQLAGSPVNPAGIVRGSGRQRVIGFGAKQHGSNAHGQQMVPVGASGNVFVKIDGSNMNYLHGLAKGNPEKNDNLLLGAGDLFASAAFDAAAVARTANGKARGQQWQGPDYNPGGGRDKTPLDNPPEPGSSEKGWNSGNNGNGVGNTWVGSQGSDKAQGGGMAGGIKSEPPVDPPDPPDDPDPDPDPNPSASAPLPKQFVFELGGCPALMNWLARELGIDAETIQTYYTRAMGQAEAAVPNKAGNAYESSGGWCGLCSNLNDAAAVLRDSQGNYTKALTSVVNQYVTTDAPPSEEQMALIATTLAEHRGDGTHYADAGEWLDAMAEYIGILSLRMGLSADEAIALALEKYVEPLMDAGDDTLSAYVLIRLESMGG